MTTTATSPRAEPASSPLTAFDALLGRPVSMRAMALLRVLVGPVVLLHLRPILDAARDGRIYRDAFYEPYASWYPELPRGMYIAMLWVAVVAALAMTVGLPDRALPQSPSSRSSPTTSSCRRRTCTTTGPI